MYICTNGMSCNTLMTYTYFHIKTYICMYIHISCIYNRAYIYTYKPVLANTYIANLVYYIIDQDVCYTVSFFKDVTLGYICTYIYLYQKYSLTNNCFNTCPSVCLHRCVQ